VRVALPKGLLVGMLTLAVMLEMMLEFSVVHICHSLAYCHSSYTSRNCSDMRWLTGTQELLPHEGAQRTRTRVGFVRRCDPEGHGDVLDGLNVVFCEEVDLDGGAGDDC